MVIYKLEIIHTVILIGIMMLVLFIIKRAIRKFSFVKSIEVNRRKVIFYLSFLIVYMISGIVLALIWGIDFKQFSVFLSSILAVLGVGFFAQWSILANLTASVILFFNHPMRIGDRIQVQDKDFDWTGKVMDITGFYVFMKTDDGRNITIPNALVMQKGVEILDKEEVILKTLKDQNI